MQLCRVTDSVVASRKAEPLRASRLLVVQRVGTDGQPLDRPEEIALDPGLDAGPGDVVLVAKEGAVVADLFDPNAGPSDPPTPANVVIVAVVEGWSLR